MISANGQRFAAGTTLVILLLAAVSLPAAAEGLQPGLWKVTSSPEVNGVASPREIKARCLTSEEATDLNKTFSPQVRAQNLCERTEHELTPTRLRWRVQCTGQPAMDVAGTFEFETPQRYTALVTTSVSIAGQTMKSRVTIEAERTGACQ